jgi:hypothetical protein
MRVKLCTAVEIGVRARGGGVPCGERHISLASGRSPYLQAQPCINTLERVLHPLILMQRSKHP